MAETAEMALGKRLEQARALRGWTQQQLADAAGMDPDSGRQAIQAAESRDSQRSRHAGAWAKALNISLFWLTDGEGPMEPAISGSTDSATYPPRPTIPPQSGKEAPAGSPDDPIEGAIAIIRKSIPVVGTAQFGDEGFWEELPYPVGHGDGYVDFPSRDSNAYALRGNGHSMAPRFRHGEFIILEPNTEVHPGDEVMVALKNGRKMGKIFSYRRDGMAYFDSINQDHAQIAVSEQDIDKMHFIAGVAKRSLYRPPN